MEPCIRYLAIVTEQPDVLADFYTTQLGMTRLGQSPSGDVSITDGFYNVTFLRQRADLGETDDRLGPHHFGIAVPDLEALRARLAQFAPGVELQPERSDVHHGEYRVNDPCGLPVSISTRGFGVPTAERRLPGIRHVALSVPNNDAMLDFYVKVFGFREVTSSHYYRQIGRPTRFAGDGFTSLAILPEPSSMASHGETRNIRAGLNHFGFLVESVESLLSQLSDEAEAGRRPSDRPMTEYRAVDPDGNGFDISAAKGYEVDVDVWERVGQLV